MNSCFVSSLKNFSTESELWWDTAPLQYNKFREKMIYENPNIKSYIELLLPKNFEYSEFGITGVTTNPRLLSNSIISDKYVVENINSNIDSPCEYYYENYIKNNANLLLNLWYQSEYKYGWMSAQIEPIYIDSFDKTVQRGKELASLSPNIMIKIPGNAIGYKAIEELVSMGFSINNTFCFSVAQFKKGIEAINRGKIKAQMNGVDTSKSQYVITYMIGRFGDQNEINEEANNLKIDLSKSDKRWAEIYIYKKICKLLEEQYINIRLLLSSIKIDDMNNDCNLSSMHLERTGYKKTIYTLTPNILNYLISRHNVKNPILIQEDKSIPEGILNKIKKINFINRSADENGFSSLDFNNLSAFKKAYQESFDAYSKFTNYVITKTL